MYGLVKLARGERRKRDFMNVRQSVRLGDIACNLIKISARNIFF